MESSDGTQAVLTSTGAVMGTVDSTAPEQALSIRNADARSDVYSLGITLWFLLTGRPAFDGDSMMARLLAHREGTIPSLAEAREDVPAELDELFRRMVAKSPEHRPQSMREVTAALKAIPLGG